MKTCSEISARCGACCRSLSFLGLRAGTQPRSNGVPRCGRIWCCWVLAVCRFLEVTPTGAWAIAVAFESNSSSEDSTALGVSFLDIIECWISSTQTLIVPLDCACAADSGLEHRDCFFQRVGTDDEGAPAIKGALQKAHPPSDRQADAVDSTPPPSTGSALIQSFADSIVGSVKGFIAYATGESSPYHS